MKMIRLLLTALTALTLTACNDNAARCWSESTKSHVDGILKNAIADRIATVLDTSQAGNEKRSHEENITSIMGRLTIKTDNYAVDSINADSGKVSCTCGISAELHGGKKLLKSSGNIASYFVAKGELGDVVSAQLDVVSRILIDLEK